MNVCTHNESNSHLPITGACISAVGMTQIVGPALRIHWNRIKWKLYFCFFLFYLDFHSFAGANEMKEEDLPNNKHNISVCTIWIMRTEKSFIALQPFILTRLCGNIASQFGSSRRTDKMRANQMCTNSQRREREWEREENNKCALFS